MNRLQHATSPYLQQHAANPVDWRPWGEEALAEARHLGRPIFLSIGYSACHWCHVMAHESFEDSETASLLNRSFIPVKVDREERPDLDHIYQSANQALTGRSGGWPLSIFLTPDLHPFYSGTYFPKEPRYGMPAFKQVLEGVRHTFEQRRREVDEQARSVTDHLHLLQRSAGASMESPARSLGERLLDQYDPVHGGLGGAPKFPHVTDLRLLLRLGFRNGDRQCVNAVAHTLDRMCAGGIMDQIGGGFARYSVDEMWLVPHFEKMLYDNGQLLLLLAETDALLGVDPERQRARHGIVSWLARRMTLAGGAFAASLDADSEGEEGLYYLWTPGQVRQALSKEDADLAVAAWGIGEGGNFEGRSIATRALSPERLRQRFGANVGQRLDGIARILLKERQRRAPPDRDEKVLTGWNALAIRGLLRHGRLDGDDRALAMAEKALRFLLGHLREETGWLAVWRDGRRHTPAFLDDHAYLLETFLDAAIWLPDHAGEWLHWAKTTAGEMVERFADGNGGFFFTPENQADVIIRSKNHFDASTPSGNGSAACALARLALASGDDHYRKLAEKTVQTFTRVLASSQGGHGQLALAEDLLMNGGAEVVAAGNGSEPLLAELGRHYLPEPVLLLAPGPETLPNHVSGRLDHPGAALCVAGTCLPAVSTVERWSDVLRGVSAMNDPLSKP